MNNCIIDFKCIRCGLHIDVVFSGKESIPECPNCGPSNFIYDVEKVKRDTDWVLISNELDRLNRELDKCKTVRETWDMVVEIVRFVSIVHMARKFPVKSVRVAYLSKLSYLAKASIVK